MVYNFLVKMARHSKLKLKLQRPTKSLGKDGNLYAIPSEA
jgi:hypothetical protein